MEIRSRILAAFFSSICVTIITNLISPGDDVSGIIFLYTFPVYIFLGVPVSIFINRVLPTSRWWYSLFYYTIIGLALSGMVLFTSSLEREEGFVVSVFTIGCVWVYFIVLTILSYARKREANV